MRKKATIIILGIIMCMGGFLSLSHHIFTEASQMPEKIYVTVGDIEGSTWGSAISLMDQVNNPREKVITFYILAKEFAEKGELDLIIYLTDRLNNHTVTDTGLYDIMDQILYWRDYPKIFQILVRIKDKAIYERALAKVGVTYAKDGDIRKATLIIGNLSNSHNRNTVYWAMAEKYVEENNPDQVVRISRKIKESSIRRNFLIDMTIMFLTMDEYESGFKVINNLENSRIKSFFAGLLRSRGGLDEKEHEGVLALITRIEDSDLKNDLLIKSAVLNVAKGQNLQALRYLQVIEDATVKDLGLSKVAFKSSEMANFDFAFELTSRIINDRFREATLGDVISLYAHKGHYLDALQMAEDLESSVVRDRILISVIASMVNFGEIEEAYKLTYDFTRNDHNKVQALGIIAKEYLNRGDYKQFEILIDEMEDITSESFSYINIMRVLVQKGEIDLAYNYVMSMKRVFFKPEILSELVLAYARLGHIERTQEILDQIIHLATKPEMNSYYSDSLLFEIATQFAQEDHPLLALVLINEIKGSNFKAMALVKIETLPEGDEGLMARELLKNILNRG